MGCPNCGSNNLWDDNAYWGCNVCDWCNIPGLNKTKTASNPNDAWEVERRAIDFPRWERERAERRRKEHEESEKESAGCFCPNCDEWINDYLEQYVHVCIQRRMNHSHALDDEEDDSDY